MNEKKEIKISLTTFIVGIIAIVLLVLVIAMGMYIATSNKKTAEPETPPMSNIENAINNTTKDTQKTESLDVNSELVQKLYGYVNSKWPIDVIVGTTEKADKIIYTTGKSNINTISNDVKLMTIIYQIIQNKNYIIEDMSHFVYNSEYDGYEVEMNNVSYWYDFENKKWIEKIGFDGDNKPAISKIITISNEEIQKEAKEIFNTTISIEKHSYNFLGEAVVYDNGNYKILEYAGGGGILFNTDGNVIKAEKCNDEIIIYDNYIASWDEEDENYRGEATSYISKFYTALDKKKEIKSFGKFEFIYDLCSEGKNENGDTIMKLDPQKAQEKYGITLPIYKHTFKQAENGNYYWVSTELTNY